MLLTSFLVQYQQHNTLRTSFFKSQYIYKFRKIFTLIIVPCSESFVKSLLSINPHLSILYYIELSQ